MIYIYTYLLTAFSKDNKQYLMKMWVKLQYLFYVSIHFHKNMRFVSFAYQIKVYQV